VDGFAFPLRHIPQRPTVPTKIKEAAFTQNCRRDVTCSFIYTFFLFYFFFGKSFMLLQSPPFPDVLSTQYRSVFISKIAFFRIILLFGYLTLFGNSWHASVSWDLLFLSQQVEARRISCVRIFCWPGQMWTKCMCFRCINSTAT